MPDDDLMSPVERLAFMARQTEPGDEPEPLPLRMVSFRVPVDLLASVQALANLTGQSRNTTMINLLEAGVYAVVNELDDPSTYHDVRDYLLGNGEEKC